MGSCRKNYERKFIHKAKIVKKNIIVKGFNIFYREKILKSYTFKAPITSDIEEIL